MNVKRTIGIAALVWVWLCWLLPAQTPDAPAKDSPPKAEPAKEEPPKAEPAKTEPPKTEPPKTEPPKPVPPPPPPAPPPAHVARKQPLVIPLIPAAPPAPSVECAVAFGPAVPTAALAFSPDGKVLAVGGYQEVLLWDLANAKLLKRVGVGLLGDGVRALVFSKDGRLLAAAEGAVNGPCPVKLLDIESGQMAGTLEGPKDVVYALAMSADGKLLAAAGADPLVYVWTFDDKKLVATLKEHSEPVSGVSFSVNGKFLASASADRTSLIWEVGAWKPVNKLQQAETVHNVVFSPDGELLALAIGGPGERMIRLRRRDNAQEARVTDLGPATPLDVLWVAQGNRLFVPCSDKAIRVFDAGNGGQVANLTGHADWVFRVVASADGTKLASAGADGTVKLWSIAENRLLATFIQLTPRTEEWLIVAAQGYLVTSAPGALQWKLTNVKTPPDALSGMLQNPELVRQAIAGAKVATPAVQ